MAIRRSQRQLAQNNQALTSDNLSIPFGGRAIPVIEDVIHITEDVIHISEDVIHISDDVIMEDNTVARKVELSKYYLYYFILFMNNFLHHILNKKDSHYKVQCKTTFMLNFHFKTFQP